MAIVRSNDPGTTVDLQLRRGAGSYMLKVKVAAITG
jgi:hypothetical protein